MQLLPQQTGLVLPPGQGGGCGYTLSLFFSTVCKSQKYNYYQQQQPKSMVSSSFGVAATVAEPAVGTAVGQLRDVFSLCAARVLCVKSHGASSYGNRRKSSSSPLPSSSVITFTRVPIALPTWPAMLNKLPTLFVAPAKPQQKCT